jgi:hypothetical protein
MAKRRRGIKAWVVQWEWATEAAREAARLRSR